MSYLVTINGGSSSIKFAVFSGNLTRLFGGQFSQIGRPGAQFEVKDYRSDRVEQRPVSAKDHAECIAPLSEWLGAHIALKELDALGHRIVHGGPRFSEPERVTPELLNSLQELQLYAPEHLPTQISLLRALAAAHPDVPQVACFDTAFHWTLPRVARMLPIPRRFFARGIVRYGFHGLSYQFLASELERLDGKAALSGRVILAHLGNGASMVALREGASVDTTMAFTPAAGLVMSTRSGDIDPGLIGYLAHSEGMNAGEFYHLLHAESGLQGISETTSDVRDLLAREGADERAADALAIFCQQAKKYIGAYAAVLGGLDTLVFAGGIGENAPEIRRRICEGLEFLGVHVSPERNRQNAPLISPDGTPVKVRVIKTDEELQIARLVSTKLAKHGGTTQ